MCEADYINNSGDPPRNKISFVLLTKGPKSPVLFLSSQGSCWGWRRMEDMSLSFPEMAAYF